MVIRRGLCRILSHEITGGSRCSMRSSSRFHISEHSVLWCKLPIWRARNEYETFRSVPSSTGQYTTLLNAVTRQRTIVPQPQTKRARTSSSHLASRISFKRLACCGGAGSLCHRLRKRDSLPPSRGWPGRPS